MGWLSGWAKKVEISVPSSDDGTLTNHQFDVIIHKGVGNNEGNVVYANNNNDNWPIDICFTTADGTTLIDFWRQESDDNDGIWVVKVPTVPASGGTTICCYYGNAGADDLSDITATFVLGDDDFSQFDVQTTAVSATTGKYEAWPGIAKDSAGNLYVVYRTSDNEIHGFDSTGRIMLRKSTDDGESWGSEIMVSDTEDVDDRNPGILIFDDDGTETILICYNTHDGTAANDRAYCRKATVASLSFGTAIELSSGNERRMWTQPILLSNGKILIAIYNISAGNTYVVESATGGDSWTEYLVTSLYGNETAIIEVKSGGSYAGGVYCLIRDESSPYTYKKTVSGDYGHTWGAVSDESDLEDAKNSPVSFFRDGDTILAAYTTAGMDLVIYQSTDECNNWSHLYTIASGQSVSYYPGMVINDDGDMVVVWCTNSSTSDVYISIVEYPFQTEIWGITGGPSISVSDGVLSFIQNAADEYISSTSTFGPNVAMRSRLKIPTLDVTHGLAAIGFNVYTWPASSNYAQINFYSLGAPYGRTALYCNDGSGREVGDLGLLNDTSYHIIELRWYEGSCVWAIDGVDIDTVSTKIPQIALPFAVGRSYWATGHNYNSDVDWITVRNITPNEPILSAGSEQSSGIGIPMHAMYYARMRS